MRVIMMQCIDVFRLLLAAAAVLLVAACASRPPDRPPEVIRSGVHSGGSIVSFSRSGELLASGGWEGTVRLWRMPDATQLRYWHDHDDSVNGIAFVADDTQIVTAGYDARLVRRDLAGRVLQLVTTPAPVTSMAADADGGRLLTGHGDGTVRLWRLDNFSLLRAQSLHSGAVKAVAIAPQAARYASGGADGQVFVWREGEEVDLLPAPPTDPWTLAFAPDGQTLSGGGWFRLYRWDLRDGSFKTLPTRHLGIIKSVQYVSGDVLASISRQTDSSVYFLDPDSGATLRRFQRHDLCGADVAVSADGRYLATTSDDASVRIWHLEAGTQALPRQ